MTVSTQSGAKAEVARIVREAGSSFFWSMRLLPRERRQAMYALYAFSRSVDDIADGEGPLQERLQGLEFWRQEVEAVFAYGLQPRTETQIRPQTRPQTQIAQALCRPVVHFGLPKAEFLTLIDGMAWDIQACPRGPTWAELERYCRSVAGSIGVLTLRILGHGAEADDALARAAGEALQLTNILRDLAEDAGRGRLYLPQEILQAANITSRDPRRVLSEPGLALACNAVAARAEARFSEARAEIAGRARRSLLTVRIMLSFYARLLARLKERGWESLEDPPRLSFAEKLWLLVREATAR